MTYKTSHKLNPSALRAYDIRGAIGEILEIDDAYYIGKAYASKIIEQSKKDNPQIALGYDGRLTSPEFQSEIEKGMVSAGAIVSNIGLGPSPMLYFTVRSKKMDGGIMVTGSHNPSHHNGCKMMYQKDPLFGEHIQSLGEISEKGLFTENDGGSATKIDVRSEYLQALLKPLSDIKNKEFLENLTIVWDAGNGAAGDVTEELIKHIPGTHHTIFTEIDGRFPNHHPDPTVAENLQDLIAKVKETKADLGIAFDGDGDRIGAVDGRGNIFWGDQQMTIYAKDVLENHPGSAIIADVKASQTFFDEVAKMGGKPIMWKTGHSYIKNKLAETNAPLAGEMSGHIFFNDDYYGYDDAVYAAVRLIAYFVKNKISPNDEYDALPVSYASDEYRIPVPEADKSRIVAEIKAKVMADDNVSVDETDGIRVKHKNGWWLLRQSNTQSVVTIRAEGNSEEYLEYLMDIIRGYLGEYEISF